MMNLIFLQIFLICFLAQTTRGLTGFGLRSRFWERNRQFNDLMVMARRGVAAVPIDCWFTPKLDQFDAFNNQTW